MTDALAQTNSACVHCLGCTCAPFGLCRDKTQVVSFKSIAMTLLFSIVSTYTIAIVLHRSVDYYLLDENRDMPDNIIRQSYEKVSDYMHHHYHLRADLNSTCVTPQMSMPSEQLDIILAAVKLWIPVIVGIVGALMWFVFITCLFPLAVNLIYSVEWFLVFWLAPAKARNVPDILPIYFVLPVVVALVSFLLHLTS